MRPTASPLVFFLYLVSWLPMSSSLAKEPAKDSKCLQLPETISETDKAAGLKLHQEVLELLAKPADEATTAFNFKLIDAFADPAKKSLDQLVLIQTLGCIRKHHMGKITRETFDRMKLDLTFALIKSMRERYLSVAKEKWAATELGPEKIAALTEIGI
jgi:hypothetical protein